MDQKGISILKQYAQSILASHLDEFIWLSIERAREVELPLLHYFKDYSDTQIFELSKKDVIPFLQQLAAGTGMELMKQSIKNWKANNIVIPKSGIDAKDMAYAPHLRKYAFIKLMPTFTQDVAKLIELTIEIENFYTEYNQISLEAFIEIQQEILQSEKDLLQTVIDNTEEGISAVDNDKNVIIWNRSLELRTGIKKEKIVGKYVFDVFPDYQITPQAKAIDRALLGEKSYFDEPLLDRTGYYKATIVPLVDKHIRKVGALTISRDITQEKVALDRIIKSEASLKEAQELCHMGNWEMTVAEEQLWWSDELFKIFGRVPTNDGFVPMAYYIDAIYGADLERVNAGLNKIIKCETTCEENEHRIVLSDGKIKWIYTKGECIKDDTGKVIKIVGIGQDITERKLIELDLVNKNQELAATLEELKSAEENLIKLNNELELKVEERTEELTASEEELKQMLEESTSLNALIAESENRLRKERMVLYNSFMNAPAGIAILQGDTQIFEFANISYEKLVGQIITPGKTLLEHFPEVEQQGYIQTLNNVFLTGEPFIGKELPLELNTKGNGILEKLFLNLVVQPLKDETGKVERIMAHIIDVTEQVKARKQIEENEHRFRFVLEKALDPILILKGENMMLEIANEPLFNLWGVDKNALGKNFLELLPEMEEQGFFAMLQDVYFNDKIVKGTETPVTFHRADGTEEIIYFNFIYQPYRDEDGKISGVFVTASDVTREVEAKKQIEASEQNLKRYKYMADNATDAFILMREDGTFAYLNELALERWGYTKEEAQNIRVPDVDAIYTDEMFNAAFVASQKERLPQFETLHKKKDGIVYPVEINMGGLTLEGKPHMFAIARDIAERKKLEEKLKFSLAETFEKNEELIRKNDFLDNFVFMAAHDLKAPVTNMKQLIALIDAEEDELQKNAYQKLLETSVDRLDYTVNGLVEVIEVQSNENITIKDMALNDILQIVLEEQDDKIKSIDGAVQIRLLHDRIVYIEAYILSIVKNLITNAIKYRSSDKNLVIDIDTRKENGFIVLTIADNGMGMDMERVSKQLFKPFTRFTNKAYGKGIGLHLIKSMVQKNGGTIEVQSAINEGSTFKIYLKEYELNR